MTTIKSFDNDNRSKYIDPSSQKSRNHHLQHNETYAENTLLPPRHIVDRLTVNHRKKKKKNSRNMYQTHNGMNAFAHLFVFILMIIRIVTPVHVL